jgi:hypothetical protein
MGTEADAPSRVVIHQGGRWGRAAAGALWAIALALVTALGTASVAGAATAGAEVLVTPGTTRPLSSGTSTTPYGVVLPPGASCPGDTAHDGYHVYSYLVPQGASPTDVSFRTGDPSRWYGYIADGAYYGAINTAETTGQIVGLPVQFSWTRLTPQILFKAGQQSATWNGGIACADTHGQVTDYWNSTLVFTADPADPHGFTWKVVDQGTVPSSPFPVGLVVGVGLLVVAAGAGAYAVRLRRRDRSASVDDVGDDHGDSPAESRAQPEAVGR